MMHLKFCCIELIFLIFLILPLSANKQTQITVPIAQEFQTKLKQKQSFVQYNMNSLSQQSKKLNKYFDKRIQLTTSQKLRYSSSILSPIFVLQKNWCHSHQGSLQINRLQDIYYHDTVTSSEQMTTPQSAQNQQEQSWIYNFKYKLLYKLSSSLTIDAYSFSQETLNKQTQKFIFKNQQIQDFLTQQKQQSKVIKHIASISLVNQKKNYLATNMSSICRNNQNGDYAQPVLVLSKNSQFLYVFNCNAVFMIQCKSVLTKSSVILKFQDSETGPEEQKLFYGEQIKTVNQYIFWLSQKNGVRIYGIGLDGALQHIETIKVPLTQKRSVQKSKQQSLGKLNKQSPQLSSLEYQNGLLYILTLYEGIFVYERQSTFKFVLLTYVQYLPELNKINKQIIVKQNFILVWTESRKWQFVAQMKLISKNGVQRSENSISKKNYVFNRYFKGYRAIKSIKVLNSYQSNNIQSRNKLSEDKKIEQQKQFEKQGKYRLLIASEKGLELFPLGIDVRQISILSNGVVNNHLSQIRQIWQLSQGVFLFEEYYTTNEDVRQTYDQSGAQQNESEINNASNSQTSQTQKNEGYEISTRVQAYLVFLNVKYPSIECRFSKQGVYTLLIEQELKSSEQKKLQQLNKKPKKKQVSITNKQQVKLQKDPEQCTANCSFPLQFHYQARYYHRLTINVVSQSIMESYAIWISFFSISILIAIIWLLIYWRSNKMNVIASILEQIRRVKMNKAKAIQFYQISPEKARERKWDELREEIQGQLSYKFGNGEDDQIDNNLMSERNFQRDVPLIENFQKDKNSRENFEQKKRSNGTSSYNGISQEIISQNGDKIRNFFKKSKERAELNEEVQFNQQNEQQGNNLKQELQEIPYQIEAYKDFRGQRKEQMEQIEGQLIQYEHHDGIITSSNNRAKIYAQNNELKQEQTQ